MKSKNICLVVRGKTQEACAAISRSYSPKTLEIMQAIQARTYVPRAAKGAVCFGGVSPEMLTREYLIMLRKEGFDINEVSDRYLSKIARDIL